MILGALAEGFGLLMIVPIAALAIGSGDSTLERFAPWANAWTNDRKFIAALALFLAAMAARSLLLFARDVWLARLQSEYEADLRLRAAATLASRGWGFASRIGQAGMQSLLLNDVPRAGLAVSFIQNAAVGATMVVVQLALTFVLSPALTLLAIAFLAAAFILSLRGARRGVASGVAISQAMDESAASGFRLHAGLKSALAQGSVGAFMAEYRSSLRRTAGQTSQFARDYSSSRQGAAFGAALAAALLLLVGVRVLTLPFPVLVASLALFARMSAPAQLLQNSLLQTAAAAPAFAAIEARLGKLQSAVPAQPAPEPLQWHEVELRDVSYQHESGLGLRAVSFQLQRGRWIGLAGASGAGKTTVVDLIAGLIAPQSGTLTIDRNRLEGAMLDHWRSSVAYVGQEGSLFDDSVRGNLLADGSNASDEELWRVLEAVGLGSRIRAFPRDLGQSVGDRGSQLSGGERQRLLLARALLRRPSLMILDEATSALDPAGEAELMERLRAIEPRPAAILVAHRETTLSHCDSVLAIQHGDVKVAGELRFSGGTI